MQIPALDHCLSTISQDDSENDFQVGSFSDFYFSILFLSKRNPDYSHPLYPATGPLQAILNDLMQIRTLIERLAFESNIEWNENDPYQWNRYFTLDIESFHVYIRSIMDYSAIAIQRSCSINRANEVRSFRKLRERINRHRELFPKEVAELIELADWFDEIRGVRDFIVHRGAETIVFGNPKDGLLFQTHGAGFKNLIDKKFLLFNENVVYFDRYAAYYYSEMYSFLDLVFREFMRNMEPIKNVTFPSKSFHPGISILKGWIVNLRDWSTSEGCSEKQ